MVLHIPSQIGCINMEMVPAKLTYFLLDGYYGSLNPFMNIFYLSLGLNVAQVGLITGMSFFVAFIAAPMWGMLADASGHRKVIFLVLCLGTTSTVSSIPWIANYVGTYTLKPNCTHPLNSSTMDSDCDTLVLTNPHRFFNIMMPLNIVAFVFFASLPSYIHAIVMNVVKTRNKITSYGVQKVFSSIGYAFFNLCSGVTIDFYKEYTTKYNTGAFFVFMLCSASIAPIGYILIKQAKWGMKSEHNSSVPVLKPLLSACSKLDSIVFLVTVFITGIANNVFQCFVFILIDDTMEATNTQKTLVMTFCLVSELVVLPLAPFIIRLFGGPITSMAIGTLSYLPRFMGMTYVTNPWYLLPMQLLYGLGYSLSWAAEMEYSYLIFPAEIRLTAVTIVSSIFFVGSAAVANIVGGLVVHQYGAAMLFRCTALLCAWWFAMMMIYYGIRRYLKKGGYPLTGGVGNHDQTRVGVELEMQVGKENLGYSA